MKNERSIYWVSVEDSLPKIGEDVLVHIVLKYYDGTILDSRLTTAFLHEGILGEYWSFYDEDYRMVENEEVLYWAYFPAMIQQ